MYCIVAHNAAGGESTKNTRCSVAEWCKYANIHLPGVSVSQHRQCLSLVMPKEQSKMQRLWPRRLNSSGTSMLAPVITLLQHPLYISLVPAIDDSECENAVLLSMRRVMTTLDKRMSDLLATTMPQEAYITFWSAGWSPDQLPPATQDVLVD